MGGAALAGVALAAAGCGDQRQAGTAADKTPVTLWWWNEQDMLKETEDEIGREIYVRPAAV